MPRAKTEPLATQHTFTASKMPIAPFLWYFQTKRGDYDQGDDITSTIDIANQWLQMGCDEKVEYEQLATSAKRSWSESFL